MSVPARQCSSSGGEDKSSEQQRGIKRKSSTEIQSPKVSERWGSTELELEKFSFTWSIKNFSAIIADPEISSPIFRGGDKSNHEWQLILRTKNVDNVYYIGLTLQLISFGDGNNDAERELKARFQLGIEVVKGVPELRRGSLTHSAMNFSMKASWGFPKFVDRSHLTGKPAARYIQDDMIKIFCEVWIEGGIRQSTGASGSSHDLEQLTKRNHYRLVSNFKDVLFDQKWADVAITTPTQTFMAHKAILSGRSSVFRAMLDAPMVESAENTINIMDFDARVVTGMLDYIYTGETKDLNAIAGDLLQIAEKYDLEGLKELGGHALSENLTVENSVQVLVLADLHNAGNLKANVLDFIKRNVEEVKKTQAFQEVVHSNKALILEIFVSNV